MANIREIGNSYKITVSCGYDVRGKQIRRYKTWTPDPKLSKKQVQKELQRQVVLFEESCKAGQANKAVKFEEFAEDWLKNVAALTLKERTLANYRNYTRRIYAAIGHLRLDKITARDIQKFISDMSNGERLDKYRKGKLSAKTIKNHVSLISGIYEYAIRMQTVSVNPCKATTLPKSETVEREIYTMEETQRIMDLLKLEPEKNLRFVVYFTLSVFTGFRRGELLGLEWRDVNFDKATVTINRTSAYTKERGIFTETPKTRTSYRTLKLPEPIMELLKRYKAWQEEYIENAGDKWVEEIAGLDGKPVANERLFTKWDGTPMFPNTPALFFGRFCKKHGLRYLSCHSFRHLNASILINAGVDVKTIQNCLGHSSATTTISVYCHAFQAAQAAAMEAVSSVIRFE